MADGQHSLALSGDGVQRLAMFHAQAHGLFQQQVPAGLEDRAGNLIVQVRRQHDHDRVEVRLRQQLPIVGEDVRGRMFRPGALAGGRRPGRDGDQGGARVGDDDAGVMAAPGAVTDQTAADHVRTRLRGIAGNAGTALLLADRNAPATTMQAFGARRVQITATPSPSSGRLRFPAWPRLIPVPGEGTRLAAVRRTARGGALPRPAHPHAILRTAAKRMRSTIRHSQRVRG